MSIGDSFSSFFREYFFELFGFLIAYLSLVVPIVQYVHQKRLEEKGKRFENFHTLIRNLVESDAPDGSMRLDRQLAVVFELRNYPEYYPVITRSLTGLKNSWSGHPRLEEEIDLTLKYIKYRQKFFLARLVEKRPQESQ